MIPFVRANYAHFVFFVFHSETPELTGGEDKPVPKKTSLQAALADGVASVFGGGRSEEEKKERDQPRFSLSAVDSLLPKIRRGLIGQEEKEDDAMVVGWKNEVRSRRDREEVLRYVSCAQVNRKAFPPTANSPFISTIVATRSIVSRLSSSNTPMGWKKALMF